MNLLEIAKHERDINDQLEANGGELTEELEKALELTEKNISKKADGYYFREEDLKNRKEVLKKIVADAQKGIKFYDRMIDMLNTRMETFMISSGRKQVQGNITTFTLCDSKPSVLVTDETKLPAEYVREKIELSIDKIKIGKDLAAGKDVPGATLTSGHHLRSKANNIKTVNEIEEGEEHVSKSTKKTSKA